MKKIMSRTKRFFKCKAPETSNPHIFKNVDVREEYANAFRTESYNEFWTRVTTLTRKDSTTWKSMGTTSASRLLSYRLFVEHLLEPNQPTVNKILGTNQNEPENKSLLSDYFKETANASILCGHLLRDTDQMRTTYRSLNKTLQSLENTRKSSSSSTHFETILIHLTKFTKYINPFIASSSSLTRFRAVKSSCSDLLKRLESQRDKVQAKLHRRNGLKLGSAVFLIALTTTITLVVLTHGLATMVAIPSFIVASLGRNSSKQLAKVSAQLDAAAKGTYILNRDLDTISRLVARLHDEIEHKRAVVEFWVDRSQDKFQDQASEVARQLRRNDSSIIDQIDELEEHLYLCFMTINRARNLVVKEILGLHTSRGKRASLLG
ncbi:hypothetical protein RND81_05G090900 [Saponaria officinalis]|uniref:Uncharacterized protein n=1 Tax=Saponaria officinalis TaxID=3572 RepID=A0AAW1KRN3_SAPOF